MASYKIERGINVNEGTGTRIAIALPNIVRRIEQLAADPHPRQSKKLARSERGYRLRVGKYRIIYQVDEAAKEVTIYTIKHRKEVYR